MDLVWEQERKGNMGRSPKWFHMLGEIENNSKFKKHLNYYILDANSSVELRTKVRFSRQKRY